MVGLDWLKEKGRVVVGDKKKLGVLFCLIGLIMGLILVGVIRREPITMWAENRVGTGRSIGGELYPFGIIYIHLKNNTKNTVYYIRAKDFWVTGEGWAYNWFRFYTIDEKTGEISSNKEYEIIALLPKEKKTLRLIIDDSIANAKVNPQLVTALLSKAKEVLYNGSQNGIKLKAKLKIKPYGQS